MISMFIRCLDCKEDQPVVREFFEDGRVYCETCQRCTYSWVMPPYQFDPHYNQELRDDMCHIHLKPTDPTRARIAVFDQQGELIHRQRFEFKCWLFPGKYEVEFYKNGNRKPLEVNHIGSFFVSDA